MEKTLYVASVTFALLLIICSTLIPASALMSLASTSATMDMVRGLLIVVMIALLTTHSSRHWLFRVGLGAAAVAFLATAGALFVASSVHVLDMLLCVEAAMALGLAALKVEEPTEEVWVSTQLEDELAVRAAIAAFQRGPIITPGRLAMVALQPAVFQALLNRVPHDASGVAEDGQATERSAQNRWQFLVPFASHQT